MTMIALLAVLSVSAALGFVYFAPVVIADRRGRANHTGQRIWRWFGWILPLLLVWVVSAGLAAEHLMNPETLVAWAQASGVLYLPLVGIAMLWRMIRRRNQK